MTWLILDRGFSFAWHTTAVLAFNDAKYLPPVSSEPHNDRVR
jgi:hypothetical protein